MEYFRAEAQLAASEAAKATDPKVRQRWLEIAESWRQLVLNGSEEIKTGGPWINKN